MRAPRTTSAKQSLTLFQRRVIQRLRKAGFSALAELSFEWWSTGQSLSAAERRGVGEPSGKLLTDFVRANERADEGEATR